MGVFLSAGAGSGSLSLLLRLSAAWNRLPMLKTFGDADMSVAAIGAMGLVEADGSHLRKGFGEAPRPSQEANSASVSPRAMLASPFRANGYSG